jgi:hypothetical protein
VNVVWLTFKINKSAAVKLESQEVNFSQTVQAKSEYCFIVIKLRVNVPMDLNKSLFHSITVFNHFIDFFVLIK